MCSSVGSKMKPVLGAASGWPVTGLLMRGTYLPMPKPLSRIQLLCTRFCPPPAPANASAPSSSATPSSVGTVASVTIVGTSAHASALTAAKAPTASSTSTAATFSISARSSAT